MKKDVRKNNKKKKKPLNAKYSPSPLNRVSQELMRLYADWYTTPFSIRDPRTAVEFQQRYKLQRDTLSRIRATQAFWRLVQELYTKHHAKRLLEVRKRLYEITQADDARSVQAIKLFLQYEAKWSEKLETTTQIKIGDVLAASLERALNKRNKKS